MNIEIENSYKFFGNRECKYFPCHETTDDGSFNCLFCYCPLYFSGDKCGGNFKYNIDGVKNCIDCNLPHTPEYYDVVVSKLKTAVRRQI